MWKTFTKATSIFIHTVHSYEQIQFKKFTVSNTVSYVIHRKVHRNIKWLILMFNIFGWTIPVKRLHRYRLKKEQNSVKKNHCVLLKCQIHMYRWWIFHLFRISNIWLILPWMFNQNMINCWKSKPTYFKIWVTWTPKYVPRIISKIKHNDVRSIIIMLNMMNYIKFDMTFKMMLMSQIICTNLCIIDVLNEHNIIVMNCIRLYSKLFILQLFSVFFSSDFE